MSRYNQYAKRVNEAFRSAKESFDKAYKAYNTSVADYNESMKWHEETYRGENAERRSGALRSMNETKSALDEAARSCFRGFMREFDQIERDFYSDFRSAGSSANQIDINVMQLLNAGVITGADMPGLIDQFADNQAMRRVLRDYADKQYRSRLVAGDSSARAFLNARGKLDNMTSSAPEAFKQLRIVAETYSGARSGNPSADYLYSISNRWESADVQKMINNF